MPLRPETRPRLLLFDVNETLLDIESMNPYFARVFGDAAALRTWFGELVLHSMALSLSGQYIDFFTLGRAVLKMVADIRHVDITDTDVTALEQAMATTPAHPDAASGLRRLSEKGYRLVTLTNSPHRADRPSPLDSSGLGSFFERQLTVDTMTVFKPSTRVYLQAAAESGVDPADCTMVAAHTWDVIGAQSAGMRGALITRPGNAPLVAAGIPQPEFTARDVIDLADQLPPTPR